MTEPVHPSCSVPPETFYASVRDTAREWFADHGALRPVAFLLATRTPDAGEPSAVPCFVVVGCPGASFEQTQILAAYLRTLATKCGAVGVALAFEAWGVRGRQEELAPWTGRLDQHPDREECVRVLGQHLQDECAKQRMWGARIVRAEDGTPHLEEWVDARSEGCSAIHGVLAGILPRAS